MLKKPDQYLDIQKSLSSKSLSTHSSARKLFKLSHTPGGKELYTYFAAVLRVTGMDKGGSFPLKLFFGNFSGHTSAGRIERCDGGYRLTPGGIDYFKDRYRSGNRQHVQESDVTVYMNKILEGGEGWVEIA